MIDRIPVFIIILLFKLKPTSIEREIFPVMAKEG